MISWKFSRSGPRLKEGQLRKVQGCDDELLLLVGLGKKDRTKDSSTEGHDLAREAVRTSISAGVRSLKGDFMEFFSTIKYVIRMIEIVFLKILVSRKFWSMDVVMTRPQPKERIWAFGPMIFWRPKKIHWKNWAWNPWMKLLQTSGNVEKIRPKAKTLLEHWWKHRPITWLQKYLPK